MFNGLMCDRRAATLLLSSSFALVGCTSSGADHVAGANPMLAHETESGASDHGHPPAPIDDGVTIVAAPPGCAPNTFDALQAQLFDAPAYGCTQAGCHGASNAGLDLRANASYAGLLGLPLPGEVSEPHGHGDPAVHDEAVPHGHDDDADHAHDEASAGGHTHAHLVPGNPDASILYDRLRAGVQGSQPVMGGLAMPLGKPAISRDLLEAVALWIRAGAPQTGFVEGTDHALCAHAPAH